jgi:hypothetical protein
MKLRRLDVAKVAVGAREACDLRFSAWEKIMSQIIVANAFGADRIDYLLRDPYYARLRCPAFDHRRLIASLRILPPSRRVADGATGQDAAGQGPDNHAADPRAAEEPSLGMLDAGLPAAESLVYARHFMFASVFHHHTLCAYDIHFGDFLRDWLPQGKYPVTVTEHLKTDDDQVAAACGEAARDARAPGHEAAGCLVNRQPFQLVYQGRPDFARPRRPAGQAVYASLRRHCGPASVRCDGSLRFPVQLKHGAIALSTAVSGPLSRPPADWVERVFVAPKQSDRARRWLSAHRETIVRQNEEHHQTV